MEARAAALADHRIQCVLPLQTLPSMGVQDSLDVAP